MKKIYSGISRWNLIFISAVSMLMTTEIAQASKVDYPSSPVTIVVPYPAGGAADIIARLVGDRLSRKWGQPVTIENKAGASGQIGTEYVGKAHGDPYKLVLATQAAFSVLPVLNNRADFNVDTGFSPIAQLTEMPSVLLVPSSLGITDLKQFVSFLHKGKPGQYSFSSNGEGTAQHLIPEVFLEGISVKATHVPYRGSPQALTAVAAGDQVTFGVDNIPSALPFIQSGKVKVLAVTSIKRSPQLPEVPTVAETAIAGFNQTTWMGLMAPGGVSPQVQQKISEDVRDVLADPDVVVQIEKLGFIPQWKSVGDFKRFVREQRSYFEKLLKKLGITGKQ